MTRAEQVAAALERWENNRTKYYYREHPDGVTAAGDTLAALLREPQPEPVPVVSGEDSELIRVARGAALSPVIERPVRNLLEDLATRLTAALADVARLDQFRIQLGAWHSLFGTTQLTHAQARLEKAEADVARLQIEVDRLEYVNKATLEAEDKLQVERDEARAALAAAEQEKAKAVAGERDACALICYEEAKSPTLASALLCGDAIRARAGRNDVRKD